MVAIVIIPADLKPAAEQAVRQMAPTSEGTSFTVALRPESTLGTTSTHYASLPIVSPQARSLIEQLIATPPFAGRCTVRSCDPIDSYVTFQVMCAEFKLEQIPLEE